MWFILVPETHQYSALAIDSTVLNILVRARLSHQSTHCQIVTRYSIYNMSTNPWAKRDAWRYEGEFTRFNRFKSAFPGLGIATAAFAVYLAYDKLVAKKDSHHH